MFEGWWGCLCGWVVGWLVFWTVDCFLMFLLQLGSSSSISSAILSFMFYF